MSNRMFRIGNPIGKVFLDDLGFAMYTRTDILFDPCDAGTETREYRMAIHLARPRELLVCLNTQFLEDES